jgi:hypothetical protein
MSDKPAQKFLPFDEVTVNEVSSPLPEACRKPSEPSNEARASFEPLEVWLLDVRGRSQTELAEQTLRAVGKALIEGENGWIQTAEDGLESLRLRNGRTDGDDIPTGRPAEESAATRPRG